MNASSPLNAKVPEFAPVREPIPSPPSLGVTPSNPPPTSTGFSPLATAHPKSRAGTPSDSHRGSHREHGEGVVPVPTLPTAPLDALSMTLLAQQLPPIPNFTGDYTDGDGETFDEWLERLEMVAATCGWNEQTKLMNTATRLRGSASRFYRSCPPQQRSNYTALTTALRQRFTPVCIQAIQSSRFHERRQGVKECRQLRSGPKEALLPSISGKFPHGEC